VRRLKANNASRSLVLELYLEIDEHPHYSMARWKVGSAILPLLILEFLILQ
jgi:hypothetical protein